MADCINCKYALLDYEEYYNTNATQWFVEDCKKGRDIMSDSDCPDYEEWEEDDGWVYRIN